jgi:hypothetical protein
MKYLFILAAAIVIQGNIGCSKSVVDELPHPEMQYTDLRDLEVKFNQHKLLDLDANGTGDFLFNTMHIGDPVLKRDRLLFSAYSFVETRLLVDDQNNTPQFSTGSRIGPGYSSHNWYEISQAEMVQKIIPEKGQQSWDGNWKNAEHNYLGVQIHRDGRLYTGWIEISFDTANEKLVLHRAAVSKVAGQSIKAGF